MPLLSSDQMVLFEKDMYEVARDAYKIKDTEFDKIYAVDRKASGAGDKKTQLLGADRLTEKEVQGQGFVFRSPVQGWTSYVCYKTFYDAVKFDKEEVEDNVRNGQIGQTLKDYAGTWGDAYRISKEEFAAAFFMYGGLTSGDPIFNGSWGNNTDSSGDLLYDSKPWFNLSGNLRTTKAGLTYYNAVTTSALNATNFGTLYDLMSVTNAYSEHGVKIQNKPDTLLTEEGANFRAACQILESEKLPGGELNDINPWKKAVYATKPMSWAYLDPTINAGAWYVLKAKSPELLFVDRQQPVLEFYRNKETRGYMATVDARFGVHLKPGAWRVIAKNGGSAAANRAAM